MAPVDWTSCGVRSSSSSAGVSRDAFLVVAGANYSAVAVATRRTGTVFPTCFFFARGFRPINAGAESSFPRRKTLVGTAAAQAAAVAVFAFFFLSHSLQL